MDDHPQRETTNKGLKVSVGHPCSEREHRKFWDKLDSPTAVSGWQRQLPPAITASKYSDHVIYHLITSDFTILQIY